jgi:hypothetical protein
MLDRADQVIADRVQLGLFMTWLAHAGPQASGADGSAAAGIVLAGPGVPTVRGARRINTVLTAVRGDLVRVRGSRDWLRNKRALRPKCRTPQPILVIYGCVNPNWI